MILFNAGEHLQKNLLGQILFWNPPWQTRPHDANDHRVEMVHQLARGCLIASSDTIKATGEIELLVVGHERREANTGMTGKTSLIPPGYAPRFRPLTFPWSYRYNPPS